MRTLTYCPLSWSTSWTNLPIPENSERFSMFIPGGPLPGCGAVPAEADHQQEHQAGLGQNHALPWYKSLSVLPRTGAAGKEALSHPRAAVPAARVFLPAGHRRRPYITPAANAAWISRARPHVQYSPRTKWLSASRGPATGLSYALFSAHDNKLKCHSKNSEKSEKNSEKIFSTRCNKTRA